MVNTDITNSTSKFDVELRDKLNRETSRIAWSELLRFFANGSVIGVSNDLDLIEVGVQISNDNKTLLAEWMALNHVQKVTDSQAQEWLESSTVLWAVVVSPWILVQAVQAT